ncbi:MAG TPA: 30S ribosomal protein S1 [Chitinophagales bacterium]|nr:30S ribosomal protein S1 [Chitinophagales bacterium]
MEENKTENQIIEESNPQPQDESKQPPTEESTQQPKEESTQPPQEESIQHPQEEAIQQPEVSDIKETEAPQPPPEVQSPHDDFDWDVSKRNVRKYTSEERSQLEELYSKTFVTVNNQEIIKGTVVSLTNTDVVLNVGFKSDGLVPLSEFRDMPDLKVGEEVEVMVMDKENPKGQLILSRKSAKMERAWERIVAANQSGEVVTGLVTNKTKGGLIVDLFGLETFLPGSQIDVKPITDYDQYVGKMMEFKVVKINPAIKNAVVSHKALIEGDLEEQRMQIISKLEKGQVLEGTIKNITDFGAFIDLGGVDGLLYITDISWGRISHPTDVLKLNQKLNVVVLDFDDEKRRISLGLKQLTPHPWDVLDETLAAGSKVKGKVVNIEDYGAFLEIQPGVEGLIHVSEISWSNAPINAKEYFKLGDEYEAMVVTIDRAERKMSLSLKQLTKDPWSDIETKYPVGSKHKGTVRNINNYGVVVELEDGITGFAHISDLSWVKRIHHPNEITKIGNDLDIVILDINKEERKLSLGHKQVEEDPWDTFETVFPVGSEHQATISKKDDKGAIVLLPYGLEAYAPGKHLRKENGKNAEADETLSFKVIEFDRNTKKIVVSHTRTWEEKVEKEKEVVKDKKRDERKGQREELQKISRKIEKSTLGDLGVLSELKSKFEKGSEEAQDETVSEDSSAGDSPIEDKKPEQEEMKAETPEVKAEAETPVDTADETTGAETKGESGAEEKNEETATEETKEETTTEETKPVREDSSGEDASKEDEAPKED